MVMYFLVMSGFFSFVSVRKHVLNMLLSLEFIMLGLIVGLTGVFMEVEVESYFILYFLTFAACEGALGLSVVVALIRTHGSDFFYNFNILEC
uniref:NADH-ubiquinone oxidoreductase chain 4L n=1 Tax=Tropostreptus microcephalus TaxID=2931683 RepID=A0A8T9JC57_9MYRI|nr:NADH dehydrogenase subunit 4L [Tropostreptus microcephalus]UOF70372.1 NADH dehydrogenase subunit 4L [Tropostreptus microcephalus]